MGDGRYDADKYSAQQSRRRAVGQDDFAYSQDMKRRSVEEWKCNPLLDPRGIKGVREARDSKEHPTSLAIAVFFDITGSMQRIPRILQLELNKLMTVIREDGGIEHPQILVGANGDTRVQSGAVYDPEKGGYTDFDRVPFQIGQFESDNRIDEQLRLFLLEGGGQGQRHEAYGLAHYAAGFKTSIDCWEKRRQKGFLFTMGDEMPWAKITRKEVLRVFGDAVEQDFTMEALIAKAREKYEVFHVVISGGSHGMEAEIEQTWRSLLGENVLRLDDPERVCELIASKIAQTVKSAPKSPKAEADGGETKKTDPGKPKVGRI